MHTLRLRTQIKAFNLILACILGLQNVQAQPRDCDELAAYFDVDAGRFLTPDEIDRANLIRDQYGIQFGQKLKFNQPMSVRTEYWTLPQRPVLFRLANGETLEVAPKIEFTGTAESIKIDRRMRFEVTNSAIYTDKIFVWLRGATQRTILLTMRVYGSDKRNRKTERAPSPNELALVFSRAN